MLENKASYNAWMEKKGPVCKEKIKQKKQEEKKKEEELKEKEKKKKEAEKVCQGHIYIIHDRHFHLHSSCP